MFRLTIFVSVWLNLAFAININEATRYELMSYGGLDAGRTDMLIKEREKKEITKESDIKRIYGFGDYNTSKLAENFEIEALPKPEPKIEPEPEVKVIEKNNYIYRNYPPYYENRRKYGDIEIIERGSYGDRYYDKRRDDRRHDRYRDDRRRDRKIWDRDDRRYDRRGKRDIKDRRDGIELGGSIDISPKRDRSFEREVYMDGREVFRESGRYQDGGSADINIGGSIRYRDEF